MPVCSGYGVQRQVVKGEWQVLRKLMLRRGVCLRIERLDGRGVKDLTIEKCIRSQNHMSSGR